MTRVASHQSQYIPWPPYFRKIQAVDVFVLMDTVQYQKGGLQNRNKIRGKDDAFWLTVPVTGVFPSPIREMRPKDQHWRRKHLEALRQSYGRSPYWEAYGEELAAIYDRDYELLVDVNRAILLYVIGLLEIDTRIVDLSDLETSGAKTDLLVSLTGAVGGSVYVSGPGARQYIVEETFTEHGLGLEFLPSVAPEYTQMHGEFIGGLSMLDMLFNVPLDTIKDYVRGL